jgi:hypothetical protein
MKMTSSNQEEKLCRYPSNDDPINLSISKKNKSRISFGPHKKKQKLLPVAGFLVLICCWLIAVVRRQRRRRTVYSLSS